MNWWHRLRALVSAAKVTLTNDTDTVQRLQVVLNALETLDNVPRIGEYGLISNPPPGSDAVALFLAGDRSAGVVVATSNQLFRPAGLPPGVSGLYDALGQYIVLLPTGILIDSAAGAVCTGPFLATELSDATGTLADLRAEVAAIKAAYNLHQHGVLGAGPTVGPTAGEPSIVVP